MGLNWVWENINDLNILLNKWFRNGFNDNTESDQSIDALVIFFKIKYKIFLVNECDEIKVNFFPFLHFV